jgi:ABC-type multidrug transport system permease subunit
MQIDAYMYREWIIFVRSRLDLWLSILPPLITLCFFTLSMANIVSEVNNVPYLFFIIPGISIMSLSNSTLNMASRTFNEGFSPILRELFSFPVARRQYIIAKITMATFLGSLQGTVFFIFGSLIFKLPINIGNSLAILLVLILASITFSGFFLCVALLITDMAGFLVSSNVIAQILIWTSSIFYPTNLMPDFLKYFSYANPASHASDLIRNLIVDYPVNSTISWTFLILSSLTFIALSSALLIKRMGKFL